MGYDMGTQQHLTKDEFFKQFPNATEFEWLAYELGYKQGVIDTIEEEMEDAKTNNRNS